MKEANAVPVAARSCGDIQNRREPIAAAARTRASAASSSDVRLGTHEPLRRADPRERLRGRSLRRALRSLAFPGVRALCDGPDFRRTVAVAMLRQVSPLPSLSRGKDGNDRSMADDACPAPMLPKPIWNERVSIDVCAQPGTFFEPGSSEKSSPNVSRRRPSLTRSTKRSRSSGSSCGRLSPKTRIPMASSKRS